MVAMTSPLHRVLRTSILRATSVTFLPAALKPQHQPRTWVCRFQRNIVSFSHTSQIHSWANNTSVRPFKWMGVQMPKNARNSPFPLRHVDPHLIHQCLGPSHSPPQMASGSNQPFRHNTLCGYTDRQTDRQMVQANVLYHEHCLLHW